MAWKPDLYFDVAPCQPTSVIRCAGIEAIVDAMEAWSDQEGVQCNGCLALMSLVRGVGEACQVRLPLGTCMYSMPAATWLQQPLPDLGLAGAVHICRHL